SLGLTLNGTSLRIWDWRNEQALRWARSLDDVVDAAWSPEGKLLAVAYSSGEVRLTEPLTGAVRRRFPAQDHVAVLRWSPDGRRLAVGGSNVQVWNVADAPAREWDWPHPQSVYALTFNRSGTRLATACQDNLVRVFAIGGSAPPAPLFAAVDHVPNYASNGSAGGCAPVFCDDDRRLVTILKSSRPGWWDAESGQSQPPRWTPPSTTCDRSLASSPDGRWVAVGGYQTCLLWNVLGESYELPHGNHV